ncbi:ABC transporter permease [Candidatus Geothermarchaeota archaeon]|nr:MAG: ABC transporter permease [Candidatus Geothermarchaeota archaeon]RLG62583.1 MAG: ABC transporter permease [Candidatus Geothermarchaeota archaeon]HEW93755.1 ABC transporter permease [Thermoprotei archaeon]
MRLPEIIVERREPLPHYKLIIYYIVTIIIGFLLTSLATIPYGLDPFTALYLMLKGSLGSKYGFSETIVRMSPILLTGLGVAIAFLVRFWNIGAEGQLYVGALLSALIGVYISLPKPLHILVASVAGLVGGALAIYPSIYLKQRYGVDEVVTTLLSNWIYILWISAILHFYWKNPLTHWPESPYIHDSAELPRIPGFGRMHLGFIIGIILIGIYYIMYTRSKYGYELKMIGLNPKAAYLQGMDVDKRIFIAALLSGALAGLAGAYEVMGVSHTIREDLSPGYGYSGILVATLGMSHPIGVFLAAFFVSIIEIGMLSLQRTTGIPYPLAMVFEGSLFAVAALTQLYSSYRIRIVWRD